MSDARVVPDRREVVEEQRNRKRPAVGRYRRCRENRPAYHYLPIRSPGEGAGLRRSAAGRLPRPRGGGAAPASVRIRRLARRLWRELSRVLPSPVHLAMILHRTDPARILATRRRTQRVRPTVRRCRRASLTIQRLAK